MWCATGYSVTTKVLLQKALIDSARHSLIAGSYPPPPPRIAYTPVKLQSAATPGTTPFVRYAGLPALSSRCGRSLRLYVKLPPPPTSAPLNVRPDARVVPVEAVVDRKRVAADVPRHGRLHVVEKRVACSRPPPWVAPHERIHPLCSRGTPARGSGTCRSTRPPPPARPSSQAGRLWRRRSG